MIYIFGFLKISLVLCPDSIHTRAWIKNLVPSEDHCFWKMGLKSIWSKTNDFSGSIWSTIYVRVMHVQILHHSYKELEQLFINSEPGFPRSSIFSSLYVLWVTLVSEVKGHLDGQNSTAHKRGNLFWPKPLTEPLRRSRDVCLVSRSIQKA